MSTAPTSRNALIVSAAEYESPRLRRLRSPAQDAEELARVLGDSEIGNFGVDVSLNEPEHLVRRRLTRFFRDRARDDLLLLHFSCHGLKDEDGRLYFAAVDTEMDDLEGSAVASEFVNGLMARSLSRRIILLLDCCYSGAFAAGAVSRAGDEVDLKERFGGSGRVVLTASSSMEYSFEGDVLSGEGRPSVFTSALVEGLSSGEADVDEDGLVSFDDLARYVADAVRERTPNQTPRKWAFDAHGDLIVARSPRGRVVRPADLPAELVHAAESPYAEIRAGAVKTLSQLARGRNEGLALSARLELETLTNDDSRQVAAAAAEALGEPARSPAPDPVTKPEVARLVEGPPAPAGQAATAWPAVALCAIAAVAALAAFQSVPADKSIVRALLFEPLAVAVVALVIALASMRRRLHTDLAAGLLTGFAVQTSAAGLAWLAGPPGNSGLLDGIDAAWYRLFVPLTGAALFWAAYLLATGSRSVDTIAAPPLRVRALALGGAGAAMGALLLPMRTVEGDRHQILGEGALASPWSALEVTAVLATVAIVAAAVGTLRGRVLLRAGVLLALGIQTILYFIGYVFAVELHASGSYGSGGSLGVVGAAAIVAAGVLELRSASRS